jgi:hypothetical protein
MLKKLQAKSYKLQAIGYKLQAGRPEAAVQCLQLVARSL